MTDTTNNPQHDINEWPYPRMDELYKANDLRWIEVSRETYWNQCECVPPKRLGNGAFMVGEAWRFEPRFNCDLHAAYIIINKRYFGRNIPVKDFQPKRWADEIMAQLKHGTNPLNDITNVNDFNTGWMIEKDEDYYLAHAPAFVLCDGSPRFKTRRDANKVIAFIHTAKMPVITYKDIESIAKGLGIYIIGS